MEIFMSNYNKFIKKYSCVKIRFFLCLGTELLCDREYLSTVRSLHLNSDYASALIDGKIQLHMVSYLFYIIKCSI